MTWNYDVNWDVTAQGRWIGGQFIVDDDTGGTTGQKNPAYFVSDIGIIKTLPLHDFGLGFAKSVTAAFNVTNLFNKYYYNTFFFQGGTEFLFHAGRAARAIVGRIDINF